MWLVTTIGFVLAVGLVLFWQDWTHFFGDDLQHQYIPTYRELGERLRAGDWPMVNPRSWHGGYIIGDVQYGLFNPVSLASYVLVSHMSDSALAGLTLGLAYLTSTAAAAFVLGRTLGLVPPLSAAVAVGVATSPYVLIINAASWLPGLVSLSWMLWAAALAGPARTSRLARAGLAVAVFLTCASGWVHTVVAMGIVLLVLLGPGAPRAGRGERGAALMAAGAGLTAGLIPFVVARQYLDWSPRPEAFVNDGFMSYHLEYWIQAVTPTVRITLDWYLLQAPLGFAAVWLVIPVLMADRAALKTARSWLVATAVFAVLAAGPSQFGPVRWSFRFVPFAVLCALIAGALIIQHGRLHRHPVRLLAAAVLVVVTLTLAVRPSAIAIGSSALIVGLLGLAWILGVRRNLPSSVLLGAMPVLAMMSTAALVASDSLPTVDLGAERNPAEFRDRLGPVMKGRVLVVTPPLAYGEDGAEDFARVPTGARGLHFDGETINGYSSIPPLGTDQELCLNLFSWSCDELVERLFAIDDATGRPLVDLLSLDGVVVRTGETEREFRRLAGDDWSRTETSELLARYEPEQPPPATFRTRISEDDLPAGTLLIAEPWFPEAVVRAHGTSYETEPYRGLLVAVPELPPDTDPSSVDVSYEFPHRIEVLALAGAALTLLMLSMWPRPALRVIRRIRPSIGTTSHRATPDGRDARDSSGVTNGS